METERKMQKKWPAIFITTSLIFLFTCVVVAGWANHGSWLTLAQTTESNERVYLPLINRPSSPIITHLEISQSTQRANNSVPLVAGRPTTVRVYASSSTGAPQPDVTVSITGYRNGALLGTVEAGPETAPVTAERNSYASTFNVNLPAAWTQGTINLVVEAESAQAAQSNPVNSTYETSLIFNQVPPLQVRIVPINYTHQGTSSPGFYPGQAVDHISDWIKRAYPISQMQVTYRSPYNFTGNLQAGNDWGTLLNLMYALKIGDGLPENSPIVYYGFVPINNGNTQWFSSGIAGIGWIGFRESVGLNLGPNDDTGILAGHEIGHNMGRRHAPCGNPAGVDPNYPYADASIGEYGLDVINQQLLNPAQYKDMMSYCTPEWISDYTYTALYLDQRNNGLHDTEETADKIHSVLIVGSIQPDGSASLQPTYAFTGYPSSPPANSDYVIQFLNDAGQIIASQPVALRYAEEPGVTVFGVNAMIPFPSQPAAQIQLVHQERVLASRQLFTAALQGTVSATAVETADSVLLTWNWASWPALVRYTADDGTTWTTLGIDVMDGQLAVDKELLGKESGYFEIILADGASEATLMVNQP